MEEIIVLKQAPIIQHKLLEAGKQVSDRILELDLENQVATPETFRSLKNMRAELNKELKAHEELRKTIKKAIANPYSEFEDLYKIHISTKYTEAIDLLKTKIDSVETEIKNKKKANVVDYFNELCTSEDVDFLTFEKTGFEINMSTTEKAYKTKCDEFVFKVKDELLLIDTQEHKKEILAEYKLSLNAASAIKTINDRKEREQYEAEKLKLKEYDRRKAQLVNIEMGYDDETNCFIHDDEIYVVWDEIKDIPKEQFELELSTLEDQIKAKKAYLDNLNKQETGGEEPVKEEKPVEAAPAPKKESEKAKTVIAKFKVSGTMPQLKALGAYMREKGIKYENLK
jgi:hypothetical protein